MRLLYQLVELEKKCVRIELYVKGSKLNSPDTAIGSIVTSSV